MARIKQLTLNNFNRQNIWFSEVHSLWLCYCQSSSNKRSFCAFWVKGEKYGCVCVKENLLCTEGLASRPVLFGRKRGKQEGRWGSCWDCSWGFQAHPSIVLRSVSFYVVYLMEFFSSVCLWTFLLQGPEVTGCFAQHIGAKWK